MADPTIITSGMHRSGTSLVASLLAELSVKLGDHLLPADPHNQPGYFEDLEFLRFHQQVLSQSCASDEPGHTDWGWTESGRLDVSRFEEFRDQAQNLLNARIHEGGPWGWKDPRTTLLLDFWDSLLVEGRYVFVYRFPWDVADSIQRLGAEVFLRNPEYAYRIWVFYNTRLRDFYIKHSDRCLLVSVNNLQDNLEKFVFLLGDKLGLAKRDLRLKGVFKDHLFKTIDGSDPLIDLVAAAWPDCVRLLSELDELADISGAGRWQARPVRSRLSRPDATEDGPIDVSVVTPCYEQDILLLEAIASAERHAPPRCELIVVNDGSRHPRTLEILDILERSGYFVIHQENAGLSKARNTAIGLARGRYILPLDDDNRIVEGFLGEAIAVLDSSPEVGVVYGDRYDFGLRQGVQEVGEFDLATLLDRNYIDACAVLRKQVWIDCQGYDPRMCPADDWDLWICAGARGWLFHHLPRVTFEYRVRPGSLISKLNSGELEALLKRVRVKHSELYWAKSRKELEAAKQLLAEQTAHQDRLNDERDSLAFQLANCEATTQMITRSRGWQLVSFYSRLKHWFLSPLYRIFSRTSAVQTQAANLEQHEATLSEQGSLPLEDGSEAGRANFEVRTSNEASPHPEGSPIFYHRPHGLPVHGITEEVIQGFTELSNLIIENPERLVFSKPDNLTLVTYNNYKRRVLIERNYEAYGINEYVVLGKEIAQWDWGAKVRPILNYLESGVCLSEYIVATDSDDVLMVNDPTRIIDLFESYSCDALFCNTFVDYPPTRSYRDFEILKYYTHPLHAHLSAGGYVARRDALIQFLREITSAYERKSQWALEGEVFNDQLAWRHLHYKYHPRIKVDFKSLIFKRYDLFVNCD